MCLAAVAVFVEVAGWTGRNTTRNRRASVLLEANREAQHCCATSCLIRFVWNLHGPDVVSRCLSRHSWKWWLISHCFVDNSYWNKREWAFHRDKAMTQKNSIGEKGYFTRRMACTYSLKCAVYAMLHVYLCLYSGWVLHLELGSTCVGVGGRRNQFLQL